MDIKDPQVLEVIRQQFDSAPFPRIPIEYSPRNGPKTIFIHTIQTPYYLRDQRIVNPEDCVILDAGSGSGMKSLALAIANPGARIVGVDLSPASVDVARYRLAYHDIDNAEFHTLSIYDLAQLNLTFDYINCDEVLYLLPDPSAALRVMQSVLKPGGVIRVNLHSRLQRQRIYRGQEIFKRMGLIDHAPTSVEADIVREFMKALSPTVEMKSWAWSEKHESPSESADEGILMNYLLAGDNGFTIPEAFSLMRSAGLEFISMLHWKQWDLSSLFKNSADLPPVWTQLLADATEEDRLRLFELLHPMNRLIDFWCGNPRSRVPIPMDEWDDATWESARVHLHPYMKVKSVYQTLSDSVEYIRPAELTYGPFEVNVSIDSAFASCLLALWDGPLSFSALVDRYRLLHPLDPVTLNPCDRPQIASIIKSFLKQQAEYVAVLTEPRSI